MQFRIFLFGVNYFKSSCVGYYFLMKNEFTTTVDFVISNSYTCFLNVECLKWGWEATIERESLLSFYFQ